MGIWDLQSVPAAVVTVLLSKNHVFVVLFLAFILLDITLPALLSFNCLAVFSFAEFPGLFIREHSPDDGKKWAKAHRPYELRITSTQKTQCRLDFNLFSGVVLSCMCASTDGTCSSYASGSFVSHLPIYNPLGSVGHMARDIPHLVRYDCGPDESLELLRLLFEFYSGMFAPLFLVFTFRPGWNSVGDRIVSIVTGSSIWPLSIWRCTDKIWVVVVQAAGFGAEWSMFLCPLSMTSSPSVNIVQLARCMGTGCVALSTCKSSGLSPNLGSLGSRVRSAQAVRGIRTNDLVVF